MARFRFARGKCAQSKGMSAGHFFRAGMPGRKPKTKGRSKAFRERCNGRKLDAIPGTMPKRK
jgi:hypothetical protein